jgi:hypothetical protein
MGWTRSSPFFGPDGPRLPPPPKKAEKISWASCIPPPPLFSTASSPPSSYSLRFSSSERISYAFVISLNCTQKKGRATEVISYCSKVSLSSRVIAPSRMDQLVRCEHLQEHPLNTSERKIHTLASSPPASFGEKPGMQKLPKSKEEVSLCSKPFFMPCQSVQDSSREIHMSVWHTSLLARG